MDFIFNFNKPADSKQEELNVEDVEEQKQQQPPQDEAQQSTDAANPNNISSVKGVLNKKGAKPPIKTANKPTNGMNGKV